MSLTDRSAQWTHLSYLGWFGMRWHVAVCICVAHIRVFYSDSWSPRIKWIVPETTSANHTRVHLSLAEPATIRSQTNPTLGSNVLGYGTVHPYTLHVCILNMKSVLTDSNFVVSCNIVFQCWQKMVWLRSDEADGCVDVISSLRLLLNLMAYTTQEYMTWQPALFLRDWTTEDVWISFIGIYPPEVLTFTVRANIFC